MANERGQLRIALAQVNPVVGDIAGNAQRAYAAIAKAWSDGAQSLSPDEFRKMMAELQPYIAIWKKERATATA